PLPGQRAHLPLLDGTSVLLGVDSRLRLPRDYGVRERAVELEGEAYFVVRHDATRPFVVRTARGTTEDLGTQFDVRAYRAEHLQCGVAEGRVVLRPAAGTGTASPLTLHPRERGVIDAGGTVTRTRGIPVAQYVSWTRGVLWFHEAPLSGVIAQLGRWYDLEIAVSDSALLAEPLTISFGPESADEALTALARVLDARVTRAGRSAPCAAQAPSPLDRTVSLALGGVPLKDALEEVARRAGVRIAYSGRVVPLDRSVSLQLDAVQVRAALDSLLHGTGAVATVD